MIIFIYHPEPVEGYNIIKNMKSFYGTIYEKNSVNLTEKCYSVILSKTKNPVDIDSGSFANAQDDLSCGQNLSFPQKIRKNLQKILYEHKNKLIEGFTSKYNIDKIVYYEECSDINIAINREKQLKWRTRIKKDKLISSINPNWEELFFI